MSEKNRVVYDDSHKDDRQLFVAIAIVTMVFILILAELANVRFCVSLKGFARLLLASTDVFIIGAAGIWWKRRRSAKALITEYMENPYGRSSVAWSLIIGLLASSVGLMAWNALSGDKSGVARWFWLAFVPWVVILTWVRFLRLEIREDGIWGLFSFFRWDAVRTWRWDAAGRLILTVSTRMGSICGSLRVLSVAPDRKDNVDTALRKYCKSAIAVP